MSKATTIHDLMTELQTWHDFSTELLEKAKNSTINTSNHRGFSQLVKGWGDGRYDNDMEALCYRLESILDKN